MSNFTGGSASSGHMYKSMRSIRVGSLVFCKHCSASSDCTRQHRNILHFMEAPRCPYEKTVTDLILVYSVNTVRYICVKFDKKS